MEMKNIKETTLHIISRKVVIRLNNFIKMML